MNSRLPNNWIQTYTGRQFWPLCPHPDDTDILDIAHALAMKCRFGGHCLQFYSVAQHSLLMSMVVAEEDQKWALMHDATEAYLPDVVRPIKKSLTGFAEIEDRLMRCIAVKFDLQWPMPATIKEADLLLLCTEKRDLTGAPPAPFDHRIVEPLADIICPMSPELARSSFLTRFNELFAEGGAA